MRPGITGDINCCECIRWPLLDVSRKREGNLWQVALKWLAPFSAAALASFLSMWLLHISTYYYVHSMLQFEMHYKVQVTSTPDAVVLSDGVNTSDISFGSLADPLEEELGYKKINIGALDAIAALFPAVFFLLAFLMDELGLFTKVMLSHSFLALGKGLFAVMTVVPDSAGWHVCKERLGGTGIAWMSDIHTMLEILYMEAFGVDGHRLRYCADMMWSGHTYVTTLYGLGVYELVRVLSLNWPRDARRRMLVIVGLIAVGEQVVEVYCVLLNRFHYTMDVAMAIMLTFLFYTNGSIAVAEKWWVSWGVAKNADFDVEDPLSLDSHGDVLVPPCCVPFCCLTGGQHIYSDDDVKRMINDHGGGTTLQRKTYHEVMRIRQPTMESPSIQRAVYANTDFPDRREMTDATDEPLMNL